MALSNSFFESLSECESVSLTRTEIVILYTVVAAVQLSFIYELPSSINTILSHIEFMVCAVGVSVCILR